MRIIIICLLFAIGIFSSLGNAETDTSELRRPACGQYPAIGCPKILDPVCGTDRVTYSNECILCRNNLRNNANIQVLKNGRC